jgi:hypothetical protein
VDDTGAVYSGHLTCDECGRLLEAAVSSFRYMRQRLTECYSATLRPNWWRSATTHAYAGALGA